ncbi:MAG: PD40 domain-containing protein [Acidimicrobiales bacterium]|nr:PD40 domain-containing protein [Acidimicrobiales bacterium]
MTTRKARRVGAVVSTVSVAALVLAACQTVSVPESTVLTVASDRTTHVPLNCTADDAPCEGTVAVRVGGLDSPAVSFNIPQASSASVTVTLTTAQDALVPSSGAVSGQVLLDQSAPSDEEPSTADVLLRRQPPPIDMVSTAADGTQANQGSAAPSLTDDGRFVAFESFATNLVTTPTSTGGQVYVKDRVLGTVDRVSVAGDGTPGDADSGSASISNFGRYVAFSSLADNLVSGDVNGRSDVFVRDRTAGTTTRVSVSSSGTEGNDDSTAPAISGDGRWVAFTSSASNLVTSDVPGSGDVFLFDRNNGTTTRVSTGVGGAQPNGDSYGATVSDNGQFVAFLSDASNLVAGDTNGVTDVFVWDRVAGTTTRVSVATDGTEADAPAQDAMIAGGGGFVAFWTDAANLVTGDTNGKFDVFVRDLTAATTSRVSVASDGAEAQGYSLDAAISDDGRYVSFRSDAVNLDAGVTGTHWDVFLHDRTAGTTILATLGHDGSPIDGDIDDVALSGGGTVLGFTSSSTNIVVGDGNGVADVFAQEH